MDNNVELMDKYFYRRLDIHEKKHLFFKKWKNTLTVKNVAAKTWKKAVMKKDVKSKVGSQGLCRNAVDHIQNFDNDDPGHKIFEALGSSLSKF